MIYEIFEILNIDEKELMRPLILCFMACLALQLFFLFIFYYRLLFYRKKSFLENKIPISVIITAKNEEDNLKIFLPKILEQDYPDFEVIVVNDASTDNTHEVLYDFNSKYPNLKITSVPDDNKFAHGKKLAITLGVKAAKNECLVFTDADCFPETNKWLETMSRNFTDDKSIVLGYGGYVQKNGLLNKYIRSDTFSIALRYFSFALAGLPFMGVGRNMAYRKSLFMANKGLIKHAHIFSGDDDLFINEVASKKNTTIETNVNAKTLSLPMESIHSWIKQKRRHLTTGPHYRTIHKLFLSAEAISSMGYYLFFALALSAKIMIYPLLAVFVIRALLQLPMFIIMMNKLKEKNILLFLFLHDIISPYINLFLAISNYQTKKVSWR